MLGSGGSPGAQGEGQGEGSEAGQGSKPGTGSEGPNGDRGAAARRAQQDISEKLRHLADKYYSEGKKDLADRAEELANEAKAISGSMKNPDVSTSDKQNLLLSRMLEASVSENRQDDNSEKLKAQSELTQLNRYKSNAGSGNVDADNYMKIRAMILAGKRSSIASAYADSLGVLILKK